MAKLSWWHGAMKDHVVLGALNQVIEAQAYEDAADLGMAEQIGRLDASNRKYATHIERLEMSLDVLGEALIAAGLVSAADLRERIESAWSARESERAAQERKHQNETVACASCGIDVDRRQTLFSEMGEVCPGCG